MNSNSEGNGIRFLSFLLCGILTSTTNTKWRKYVVPIQRVPQYLSQIRSARAPILRGYLAKQERSTLRSGASIGGLTVGKPERPVGRTLAFCS